MKRMLFNATQSEEIRVAIVNEDIIEDLDYERSTREQRKSNIYKGKITRVEPSLEAAFVNYGVDRHGFLPFKEISKEFYSKKSRKKSVSIADVIDEGQEVIIQVTKEERGNKGAALTTYLSLAGRYIVLMPNNPDSGGISRRIEGDERVNFKDALSQLTIRKGMSVIGRTAGIGTSVEEIQWDLDYLTQLWDAIQSASSQQESPFLIYQESNLVIRAIRDYFHPDIEEIIIDNQDIYDQASQFMNHVMPDYANRIELYEDNTSLFSKYNIERQIESAFLREVQLPSGGVIVIDHTEALVSVDVNSSRSTKGRDIENTAFNTNIEAAREIAKQLRLRDIGGLIVVDFIDMESTKHQREVEECLRDSLKHDKARIQTGRISRFGLLELSRQRLRPSIGETSNGECPKCNGTGRIRDFQSSALHIIRLIQDESNKKSGQQISVQVPVDVATFILNEKRELITQSETDNENKIFVIPNKYFEVPQFKITSNELSKKQNLSYQEVEVPEFNPNEQDEDEERKPQLQPAVKGLIPEKRSKKTKNKSLFGFIKGLIASDDEEDTNQNQKIINDSSNDSEEIASEESRQPNRNNRRRRNFRNKNSRNNKPSDNNGNNNSSNSPESDKQNITDKDKKEFNRNRYQKNSKPKNEKSLEAVIPKSEPVKTTDTNKSSANLDTVKPKPKKVEELKDINLEDVGLKLVETSKKSQPSKQEAEDKPAKPTKRKKANWEKPKLSKPNDVKLVMVETKNNKAKPKAGKKTTTENKSVKKTAK